MSKKRTGSNSTDKKQSLTLKVDSKNEEPKQKSKVVNKDEVVTASYRLTDAEIASLPIENLPVEADGTRILSTIEIAPPEGVKKFYIIKIPVRTNEQMIKLNVMLNVKVPLLETIPVSKIAEDESVIAGKSGMVIEDTFYATTDEAFDEVQNYVERCGGNVIKNEDVEGDKSFAEALMAAQKREDGYYDDLHEYWYDSSIFHEKDVIWFNPLEQEPGKKLDPRPVVMNLDEDREPLLVRCDITQAKKHNIKIENGYRVLSKEEAFEVHEKPNLKKLYETPTTEEYVFWLAKEYAKTQNTVGFAVVCYGGKFYVPCESFFDESLIDFDHLIVLFNAVPCLPAHHLHIGALQADIGNMSIRTHVRYHKGSILDWATRRDQEVLASRKVRYEDYSPYDDPYDDPTIWWYFEKDKDYDDDDDNDDNTDDKNDGDDNQNNTTS